MKKHGSNLKFALVCAEDVLGQQMRAELRKHGKSEISNVSSNWTYPVW